MRDVRDNRNRALKLQYVMHEFEINEPTTRKASIATLTVHINFLTLIFTAAPC